MPPTKRVSRKTTVVLETVIDPVPVVEAPLVIEAPVAAPPVAAPAPVKKQKKQPKIVAVVTPDGIEGSFLPEPRRPLIAHLQVNSTEVKFHDIPIPYDPNPPSQPEPYDAMADNFFTGQNENVLVTHKEEDTPDTNEVVEEVKPQPSMQAFMKIDLMVEYSQTKISKKLPDTTDVACFWCAHEFKNQPCVIPEREEKGVYRVYGNFCSPSCGMAYLLQESLDTHVRWERVSLLHRVYSKAYETGRIFPAPLRDCLKLFGGPMTIEQFRDVISQGKIRIDIQIPPMVSILGSIDTKPIDFYDSSMKNTISPLLGEAVPKAEEGLRLKRSRPLKEKESTLDSVLKIQIKGRS
jgi:hypothetical protein